MNSTTAYNKNRKAANRINQLGNILLLQMILSVSLAGIVYIIYLITGLNNVINNSELESNITLLGVFSANMISFYIYKKKLNVETKFMILSGGITYRALMSLAFLTIGIMKILGYFGNYITNKLNIMSNQTIDLLDNGLSNQPVLITLIVIFLRCIIIPISEECFYRGIMLEMLREKGEWFAIITTGIIFSLVHCNTNFFLSFAVGGIILGYIALNTRSIIPSIIIHCAYNLLIRIQLMLGIKNISLIYTIDLIFMITAIMVMLWKLIKKKFFIDNIRGRLDIKQAVKCLLKSPTLIGVVLFYILLMGFSIKR